MRNQLTKLTCIVSILSFCLIGNISAQIQETESLLNAKELTEFNHSADPKAVDVSKNDLLFWVVWYEAPYNGYFDISSVSKNGQIYGLRYIVDWSIRNNYGIAPNSVRSAKFVEMMKQLQVQEQSIYVKPKDKERHTAFVYLQDNEYKRVDYGGEIPFDVQSLVDFANSELTENNTMGLKRPPRKN